MVTVLSTGTTNMLIFTFRHYFQLSSIIFFLLQTRYITEYKNHSTFGILHAGTTCELKWRSKSDFFLLVLEQMLVVEWKSFFFLFHSLGFSREQIENKNENIYIKPTSESENQNLQFVFHLFLKLICCILFLIFWILPMLFSDDFNLCIGNVIHRWCLALLSV